MQHSNDVFERKLFVNFYNTLFEVMKSREPAVLHRSITATDVIFVTYHLYLYLHRSANAATIITTRKRIRGTTIAATPVFGVERCWSDDDTAGAVSVKWNQII